jgi:hypothetical protein
MSTMSKCRNFVGAALVVLLAATLPVGCGGSDSRHPDNPLSQVDFGKSTIANCLKTHGAFFAVSTNDLAFFSQAEADDTASKFGFAAEESAGLLVELYEDGEDPREWVVWAIQPLGEQKSPSEIVEDAPSKGYVAYSLQPSNSQRKALEGCVT